MSRLWAIDLGSIAAWQFFAKEDDPEGMLDGVHNWFRYFIDHMKPDYVAVCFDAGHARRAAIDPEYKLNRKVKPAPEGYIEQLRQLPEVIDKLGLCAVRFSGEEADDAIASIATQHASAELEVIVCSSDKDLGALVTERVKLYDPRPDADGNCRYWDAAGVKERLGVPPWRVPDYLAMAGDSADNIAGIVGIGKKYALAAIQQTKSMAEVFRKASRGELQHLGAAAQAKIAAGKAQFDHAMQLVELRCDLPVPQDLDAFRVKRQEAA